jgi:hypothetical protein
MIEAVSLKNTVILSLPKGKPVAIERSYMEGEWQVWTKEGWHSNSETPLLIEGYFSDYEVHDGIYQYRAAVGNKEKEQQWEYSPWVRCGETGPRGYTFGNYHAPTGQWGEILTADDLHYTYLWGIDFRASNGMPYTDAQTQFHINSALAEVCRRLNITVKQTRIVCDPAKRGLKLGIDYDEEESYYTFRRERIQRNGTITTRKRPVQKVMRLELMSRDNRITSLLESSMIDKMKGVIRFYARPMKMEGTMRGVMAAVMPYGTEQYGGHLMYGIDYVAGYESSDAVPDDLRAIIGKVCAVEMLNIIGDGILAGFSSSSLSMDGVSESFSSTQSATSATYGARIKQYSEEIESYLTSNKMKFGHWNLGAL